MNLPDYTNCTLCPRMCHVNRSVTTGYCGCSSHISAARAALHKWEEPVLSGPEEEPGGSGAVFFSGCTLRCCFCQNSLLSKDHFGKKLTVNELGDAFLRLQDKGAYNINLVTPTQFFPDIIKALDLVRHKLHIPVVCNCGGYECPEILDLLDAYHVPLCCYGHIHSRGCRSAFQGMYHDTEFRLLSADYISFCPRRILP